MNVARPRAVLDQAHCYLADLVALARPVHSTKNVLVAAAPLLAGRLWNVDVIVSTIVAFAQFSLASAVVYIVNDLFDRERDRQHPRKRSRPIASGRVSTRVALLVAGLLAAALAGTAAIGGARALGVVVAYLALNLLYSSCLKHVELVEAFVVAGGFVLRVGAGAVATHTDVSSWLLLLVLSLCLLVVLGKRRHEMRTLPETARSDRYRPVLARYSVTFLDNVMLLCALVAILAYTFYLDEPRTLSTLGTIALPVSLPCLLLGLFRYLQVVHVDSGGGDPVATMSRDRMMLTSGLLWIGALGLSFLITHSGHGR